MFSSSSIAGRKWNISPGNWCVACVYTIIIVWVCLSYDKPSVESCWMRSRISLSLFFRSVWLSFSRSIKWTAIKIEALRDQIIWMTKWDWFLVNSKTLATAGNVKCYWYVRLCWFFLSAYSSCVSKPLMAINSNINNLLYVSNVYSHHKDDATHERNNTYKHKTVYKPIHIFFSTFNARATIPMELLLFRIYVSLVHIR